MKPQGRSPTDAASPAGHQLLTPTEVTALFGVNSRTLRRWTRQGLLPAQRTLGGHHRYPADVVARCLATTWK